MTSARTRSGTRRPPALVFQKQVVRQIEKLGGQLRKPRSTSLEASLAAVRFPNVLFPRYWEPIDALGAFRKTKGAPDEANGKAFREAFVCYCLADDEAPRGQAFWRPRHFRPLTPGTEDFDEWSSFFEDVANLEAIREVVGDGPLEFFQLIYSYGWPDHYYVCLQDPKPANPTVFSTDHEVFFTEIDNRGPLSTFLANHFLTPRQLEKRIREHLEHSK